MASSNHQRSLYPSIIIHDVPKVIDPVNVSKESVAENASGFRRVLSTPPQRKEEGKKRGLDNLSEKPEVSNQPAKRKCRIKVADNKFRPETEKATVTVSEPDKVKPAIPKKDPQEKRKYVRKKKEEPNVAVRPPEANYDVPVSEETLSASARGEVLKAACKRALVFDDENLTHMSSFTAPEPPSPEDGTYCEKAVQPPLFGEEKLSNHEAEERYVSSDDLLNLAEQKDSMGASRETLDYGEVDIVSTAVDMSKSKTDIELKPSVNISSDDLLNRAEQKDFSKASGETLDYEEVNTVSTTVDMSEPNIDMDLKAIQSPRLERDSSKKNDESMLKVYVRRRKIRRSINIQHKSACVEATSAEEVRVNENKSRGRAAHVGSVLDSVRQESQDNITVSRRRGLNSRLVNAFSKSQTNKNKTRAMSNYKNEDHLAILHNPLTSNGRNTRACQCIQLMRKRIVKKFKIKKRLRMIRKQRVDMSGLSLQTLIQLMSKEPISQDQKASVPTRRQRSKCVRRRDILSLLTCPPLYKPVIRPVEQQSTPQVPKMDIWPTHDNLVTMSKSTSPSGEENACVGNQEVNHTEEPQPEVPDPIFTINQHLFARDMSDDRGYESQNFVSMQSDPALETDLNCSTMNALSFPHLYRNFHSMGPWTWASEEVPVHRNVYSVDNFYLSQNYASLQPEYSLSMGAGFHSIGQPPLLETTYNNSQLLNHVQFCVTNQQEFIPEERGGAWTIDDPNHQSLLYNNQLPDPHREPGLTAEADNYSVNSHLLVPYCDPSKSSHGQELPSRVDNGMTMVNDTSNQALVVSVKKKKVISHVNFDSKTLPMWKALMGTADSSDQKCNEDDESKKWWQEERRVFKEKVQAFISCMHKIQGNRRFSKWKGSVLDSVMGVFLTQNVSDHLSSSAYMSLAAKYPIGTQPTHSQKTASEESEVGVNSLESCGSNEVLSTTELSDQESLNEKISDGDQAAQNTVKTDSRNEIAEHNPVKDDNVIPTVGLSGFEEWLSAQEQVIQPQDISHPKSERKECLSQQEQNTSPQNPSHPKSETVESLSQQECVTQLHHSNSENTGLPPLSLETESQNSIHRKSETEEMLSHQPDQTTHSQDSSLQKSETDELPSHQQEQSKQHQKSETDELPSQQQEQNKQQDSTNPKAQKSKAPVVDWRQIKIKYCSEKRERSEGHTDSVDWDAVRRAPTEEVAEAIKKRGQHNILAATMQKALNRIFSELGSLDLEWLRTTPPDVTKNFLLSVDGLGLKSVECIRLLALEQVAFPVDTNVGRIAVRLGWVDLKDVPEGLQFHLYPMMDAIQKYLWPRLCELDQLTLYELHYQMITFGKVFCKKRSPYCNSCPLRASCKYFASAYVSVRLPITDGTNAGTSQPQPTNCEPIVEMLPSPGMQAFNTEPDIEEPISPRPHTDMPISPQPYNEMPTSPQPYTETATSPLPNLEIPPSPQPYNEIPTTPQPGLCTEAVYPIIELARTPEPEDEGDMEDIEDLYKDEPEIPTIVLNDEEFKANVYKYIHEKKFGNSEEISNAIVVSARAARIPARKLKNIKDLRTEHLVYEIPDDHPILHLHGLPERDPDDPCSYLLAIWSPDEHVTLPSEKVKENSDCGGEKLNGEGSCLDGTCQDHDGCHVFGTFLIPCRTAMKGRFPLNGTYFQVNEVFADDESSHRPVKIPRSYLWKLHRRIVYCGSSASAITTGLTLEEIQVCFWTEYVCVRGFNRRTMEPKELADRLHKLKTATQTKRPNGISQRNRKKNKNGTQ